MTLVLKVNCRACNRECGDYKHLLDETVIDDESTTLAALLSYCTSLECFAEFDYYSMPEHICNSCVEHLLQSYLFKEMVLQTDRERRERLKLESEAASDANMEIIQEVEESPYAEHDVDVGGADEDNPNGFMSKVEEADHVTREVVEEVEEVAEYEMEEWLEVDDALAPTVTTEEVDDGADQTQPEEVDDGANQTQLEEDDDGADQTSKENFVKIEDCTEIDEDGYLIMEENYNSDTMEDLEGFEKENEQSEEIIEEDSLLLEKDETKKVVPRKKFVKHSGLTEADLQCQYCGKQYNKMCRLREHTYVHTGEKPHVCKICGKRSRTKTHYNVHMLTHSEEKRYRCSICGQNYRTSTSLRVHERKHSDIRPYACTICDKSFHTSDQKKMHVMIHTGERPFSCELCGKSYRESHSLKQHMLTHADKKPFECEICGKGLTQMSGYKRHMLLHTNEYPYSCDICGRPFRISSNLVTHKRLHLDVLPYQCTKCDKGFNNSTRLKRHLAQHDQEHTKDTFKPRKPRQESVIVDTKMSKSRVVEIL